MSQVNKGLVLDQKYYALKYKRWNTWKFGAWGSNITSSAFSWPRSSMWAISIWNKSYLDLCLIKMSKNMTDMILSMRAIFILLLIRCKKIWWAINMRLKTPAGHITWRILWLRCNIPECDCFACKNLKRSTTNRYSSKTLKLEQLVEINLPRWQTQVEWTSCSPVLLFTAGQEEAAHAPNWARIFRNKVTLHVYT